MTRALPGVLAHAALLLAACAPAPRAAAPRASAPPPSPKVARIDLENVGATALRFAPAHRATIVDFEACDAAGPITVFATNDAARLEAALDGRAEIDLPPDLLGPCYRLVRKDLVAFELGFVTSAEQEMKVTSVKPESRAAAAGVRAGDVVSDIHYEDDRSDVPVDLTITRDGKKQKLRFLPAGPARRGRTFERVPGVPDSRC